MQPSNAASHQLKPASSFKVLAILILIAGMCPFSARAGGGSQATTTSLGLSSAEVAAGTAVTLTATVTAGGSPLARGRVVFCDANAARCADSAIFGQAQLTAAGTATIKLTLGVGTYSIVAAFQPLSFALASGSAPQALTVDATASYLSFSDIASSGTPGNYTLTGAVAAFGRNIPIGAVSFLDTDSGDAVVGTAVLDRTTLGFILLPAEESPATVGSRPQNTVLGDFNNDGKLDLAATNVNDNTISVLLGNGDGTFQLQAAYASGASPSRWPAATSTGTAILTWWRATPAPPRSAFISGMATERFCRSRLMPWATGRSRLPWPISMAMAGLIWRWWTETTAT